MDEAKGDTYKLLVEGDDLLSVMSTVGKCHYYTITIYHLDRTFAEIKPERPSLLMVNLL